MKEGASQSTMIKSISDDGIFRGFSDKGFALVGRQLRRDNLVMQIIVNVFVLGIFDTKNFTQKFSFRDIEHTWINSCSTKNSYCDALL